MAKRYEIPEHVVPVCEGRIVEDEKIDADM